MEDLRGYSEEKRVKNFETWSKWPIWFKCCSAGVLNGKHFYRWYTSEEILMAKKLTWNNKGLELLLLSKKHRLNLLQHPLHTPPPPPTLLNPLKNNWSYKIVLSPLKKKLICLPPLQDTSVYPPNMRSPTLMIVTVGPLPSQLLWNVDAAQPSVLACQHLTKSVRDAVGRTGSKNVINFPKYLLGSKLPRISDAPRPPVCVKETGM